MKLDGAVKVESKGDPAFHVRGATKIYRHACWVAIGGLLRETGWDTYDEVKANMLGWETRTFDGLQLVHHRETGGADGTWKNWVKNGRANYIARLSSVVHVFQMHPASARAALCHRVRRALVWIRDGIFFARDAPSGARSHPLSAARTDAPPVFQEQHLGGEINFLDVRL